MGERYTIPVDARRGAQVHNDGTYGWVASGDVRTKWMQTAKVATYPEFLWTQPDTEIDGRVAGRRAVNTSLLPAGKVIFGRWSDAITATWAGAEILVARSSAQFRPSMSSR